MLRKHFARAGAAPDWRAAVLLIFLSATALFVSPRTPAQTAPAAEFVAGELLVKFKPNTPDTAIQQLNSQVGATAKRRFRLDPDLHLLKLGPFTDVAQARAFYEKSQHVLFAEPNFIVRARAVPNDPSFNNQWGLHNTGQTGGKVDADIDGPEAWDIETGASRQIVIASIDTGVDLTHPDIVDNLWVNTDEIANNGIDDDSNGFIDDINGWNFVADNNNPDDDNGHGSHTAGTIAATGNNGQGVTGVMWRAKIMALKFLNSSGSGSTADAIAAIDYATDNGALISNNSWGGGSFSQALLDAIRRNNAAGRLFVAAAGNSGANNDSTPHFPSSYEVENIIAVAAIDQNDQLASFSNFGATSVDLGAPGVGILSLWKDGQFNTISGTSMATPHVAGVAGLIWANRPSLTHHQVKQRILATVRPISSLSGKTLSGGAVNAFQALRGIVFLDEFEDGNAQKWAIGAGSNAATGAWVIGDPVGTFNGTDPAQPENDHTAAGVNAAFTAQNPDGNIGVDDVDGGQTILQSRVIDLSGLTNATLTYWRWFYNRDLGEDSGDFFAVQVSSNGGSSWVELERLGTNTRANSWTQRQFLLGDFIPMTNRVVMRFIASDGSAAGNIIEAALDDVVIEESSTAPVNKVFFADDLESGNVKGWRIGSDSNATTGAWIIGDPVATFDGTTPAQPGEDNTVLGTNALYTAANPDGNLGIDDVDGGQTVLLSPVINLSGVSSATLSYARWFYNRDLGEDSGDFFKASVSNNGGSSWVDLEVLGTNNRANSWTARSFRLESFVTLTNNMVIRFIASDGSAAGNIIEAAVDDIFITGK